MTSSLGQDEIISALHHCFLVDVRAWSLVDPAVARSDSGGQAKVGKWHLTPRGRLLLRIMLPKLHSSGLVDSILAVERGMRAL